MHMIISIIIMYIDIGTFKILIIGFFIDNVISYSK